MQSSYSTLWWTFGAVAGTLSYLLHRSLSVPSHLRHLPAVPILPVLLSYMHRESDDVRIKRLVLPYANTHSEGVVLMWAIGKWMVHILDPKIVSQVAGNVTTFPKFFPPGDFLLIRFVGMKNAAHTNGKEWKRLSVIINDAFSTPIPVELYASLSKGLFRVMDETRSKSEEEIRVNWTDLAQRFALDAVGYSVIGYQIDAIGAKSQFVEDYNNLMKYTADPLYLAFPILDKIIPGDRHVVMNRVRNKLTDMLLAKRLDPGDDMMSFILRDPTFTKEELGDIIGQLFIAGHDTTAGALSSLVYYLSINQDVQKKARAEAIHVLGSEDPSVNQVNPSSIPYINACVKETLRINSPAAYPIPRMAQEDITLGKYYIPANTIVVPNIYSVHYNEDVWGDPNVFRPQRFLDGDDSLRAKGAWIPFLSGLRRCPADNFAQYELRTLTSMLLREYEWILPADSIHADGIKNAPSPFALNLPRDLDIIFRRRV